MILFGTMRRSKSVTVTATSTAQPSESTSASTERPNVAMQATTRAAKTTTAMGRSLRHVVLRSCCRSGILPAAASSIEGRQQLRTATRAGERRRSRRPPRAAGIARSRNSTTTTTASPTSCTEVLRTGSHSAAASRPTTAAPMPATAAWISVALPRRRPERQRRPEQQERRQEDRDERDRRARDAVRRRILDRAEVGREREQRPGHRLGGAVAGQECLLRDPPRGDDGLVEERQDDVAAAEDERTGAVEAVEQAQAVRREGVGEPQRDEEQQHEELRAHDRRSPADRERERQRQRPHPAAEQRSRRWLPPTRIVASCPNVPG